MVQSACPLCRHHFDQRTVVKLHIDFDTAVATCHTPEQEEAQRLHTAIVAVANKGTTEHELRQLITEVGTFLGTQSQDIVRFFIHNEYHQS